MTVNRNREIYYRYVIGKEKQWKIAEDYDITDRRISSIVNTEKEKRCRSIRRAEVSIQKAVDLLCKHPEFNNE